MILSAESPALYVEQIAACLTVGGHIGLRVSRPVWYAASSAAAGYPVPATSILFWSPGILVRHISWCRKHVGSVQTA